MSVIKKAKYFAKGIKEKPIYMYSNEEMEIFEQYVTENIGKFEKIYHELYSPDVHLDILVIPPSKESNYYKLVTEGMGAYKMNVPDEIKDWEIDRAELIIYLPPDWNMQINKESKWIIEQLKIIGRLPIEEKSWVGFGHTFSHSENGDIPFSENVNFSATLLVDALDRNQKDMNLRLDQKGKINFYQLIPIYKEELQYKQSNGLEALLERFTDEGLDLVVDVNRKNFCDDRNLQLLQEDNEEEIEK